MPATVFNVNFHINVHDLKDVQPLLDQLQAFSSRVCEAGGTAPIPKFFGPTATFPQVSPLSGAVFQKVAEQNLRLLAESDVPQQGWGRADLPNALAQLPIEARKVVLRAIENGGHVSRDEVYELLDRTEEQSLRGFTRPVNRIMSNLQQTGEIDGTAEPLLSPVYDQTSNAYQQAQGFVVPLQVVFRMKGLPANI